MRPYIATRTTAEVLAEIVRAIETNEVAQVPGYNSFEYVRETPAAIIVRREKGTEATVPKSDLERAIDFIRNDQTAYLDGPERLRECGITHVNSVVWALIRQIPLNDIIR